MSDKMVLSANNAQQLKYIQKDYEDIKKNAIKCICVLALGIIFIGIGSLILGFASNYRYKVFSSAVPIGIGTLLFLGSIGGSIGFPYKMICLSREAKKLSRDQD